MKLFFASDLHGSQEATEKVLEHYRQSGAEHLVILGRCPQSWASKPGTKQL